MAFDDINPAYDRENAKQALANLAPYLDLDSLIEMDKAKLEELIYPAGFYKQKVSILKHLLSGSMVTELV